MLINNNNAEMQKSPLKNRKGIKEMKWGCILLASLLLFTVPTGTLYGTRASGSIEDGIGSDTLENAVVLYIGSPFGLVNNTEAEIYPADEEVTPYLKSVPGVGTKTMAPLRFIAEGLGAIVNWDGVTSTVALAIGSRRVEFRIGSSTMTIDGQVVAMDLPAEIFRDKTFIPLRQIAEAFDKKVFFDRGLIVISDSDMALDPALDSTFNRAQIDSLIARVNKLPLVGTYENLKRILEKQQTYAGILGTGMVSIAGTVAKDAVNSVAITSAESSGSQATAAMSPATGTGSNGDYSTTNVQVQGVDEADIVKTDGEYIYQVNKGRIAVVKAAPTAEMALAGSINFEDASFAPREIYLKGSKLVVIGETYSQVPYIGGLKKPGISIYPYYNQGLVKASVYDVADKNAMKLIKTIALEGGYVSSRMKDQNLYLVANRQFDYHIMQEGGVNDVPSYMDSTISKDFIKMGYEDIKYFPGMVEGGYMTIASLNVEDNTAEAKVSSFLGAGETIYASNDNLYVAHQKYESMTTIMPMATSATEPVAGPAIAPAAPTVDFGVARFMPMTQKLDTLIYKFALNGENITYVNKGVVPGRVLNQFSMDESGKFFRIATTTGYEWGAGDSISKNNLYVLDEAMGIAGRIENIAPGERIYSARFMGDRAYLVTFRNVDPLYVIGLQDPYNPTILGALKIPGYSNYLHPYDENHIIGFGKETVEVENKDYLGNTLGTTAYYLGMKMAIFDVTDVNSPKELYKELIGDRGTDSELLHNHKALLFSLQKGLLAFPVTLMETGKAPAVINPTPGTGKVASVPEYGQFTYQGAYVYDVDLTKGFRLKGRITHLSPEDFVASGYSWGDSQKYINRILYIGESLYTLSDSEIRSSSMVDLTLEKSLLIP